jgi:hypothetical protein
MHEAFRQAPERFRIFGLPGGVHHRQGPAVKRAERGDHLESTVPVLLTPFAGKLEGAFIRFRAAVGQEHARRKRQIDEAPRKLHWRHRQIVG